MLYLAALLFVLSCVLAQTPIVIDWHVSWFNACPDGFCRNVITVNNQWPPAVVRVRKREVYTLRVFNELNDGECITVHTHGIDQWGSNPHDGVDGVTQWSAVFEFINGSGIPPGQSFNYTPNLQDQVGTYWLHTHIKGQYPEGLRAPFIVDDLDVPFNYDFDEVLSVSDWVLPFRNSNCSTIGQ
jgi:iron transport multicopper oxidase